MNHCQFQQKLFYKSTTLLLFSCLEMLPRTMRFCHWRFFFFSPFSLLSGSFLQRKRERRHESTHGSEMSALLFAVTSLEKYKKKKAAFSFRSPICERLLSQHNCTAVQNKLSFKDSTSKKYCESPLKSQLSQYSAFCPHLNRIMLSKTEVLLLSLKVC